MYNLLGLFQLAGKRFKINKISAPTQEITSLPLEIKLLKYHAQTISQQSFIFVNSQDNDVCDFNPFSLKATQVLHSLASKAWLPGEGMASRPYLDLCSQKLTLSSSVLRCVLKYLITQISAISLLPSQTWKHNRHKSSFPKDISSNQQHILKVLILQRHNN